MPSGVPVMIVTLMSLLLAAQPELPAAPATGVDPDVTATLDAAKAAISANDASADRKVLSLHLSTDRFSAAQERQVRSESARLLREAGALRARRGDLELAARDYDAAWTLAGGGHDQETGEVLARYAEQLASKDVGAALWVARRALIADSGNGLASALDHRFTNNPFTGVGYGLMAAAVASIASAVILGIVSMNTTRVIENGETRQQAEWDALIARQQVFRWASTGGYAAGGTLGATGLLLLWLGVRTEAPVSPAALPALREVTR